MCRNIIYIMRYKKQIIDIIVHETHTFADDNPTGAVREF